MSETELVTEKIVYSMLGDIEKIRLENGHETSSHAFASLMIWKDDMDLSVYLTEALYAVKYNLRGDNTWFFPCGKKEAVCPFVRKVMEIPNLIFCYMRQEDKEFLEREFPGEFQISEAEGDWEYLYDREAQCNLKGRKFSGIRNHIHRAQNDLDLHCEPLSEENIAEAIAVNRTWSRQSDSPGGIEDCYASEFLLKNYKELGVLGILIRVEKEPYCVTAGYPISENMFDLSLAKQKSFLPGLGAYSKHAFICSVPRSYTLINAEEDLGIEGLRTMKHQMRPCGMIKMYEGRVAFSDNKS